MARRTWYKDQSYTSQGVLEADGSFVTNGAADPDPTLFRGFGGLTGPALQNGMPNSSPSAVASVTRVSAGLYRLTMVDGYRFLLGWDVNLQDAADNLMPRLTNIQNEGQGATTPVSVDIVVRNMSTGAVADSTGRRISFQLVLKDSGNGV